MKFDYEKLFDAAKKVGVSPIEARVVGESKIEVSFFNDNLENYTVAESGNIKFRGLKNGKCGAFLSDRIDDDIIDMAVKTISDSADYGQETDAEFFIGGGKRYEKVNAFSKKLEKIAPQKLIDMAKSVASVGLEDKRVESMVVQVEYQTKSTSLKNSFGLDVSTTANFLMVFAQCKVKDGEEVENFGDYELVTDPDSFDCAAFARRLVEKSARRLGGKSVKGGKYTVVYSPDSFAQFISAFKGAFSAFNAEQHVSLLEGKMGNKVFSELLTVEQTPIGDCCFCSPFDAEGMPCKNALLIDKGTPTGYVYDLATAKRAGVSSTGNGGLIRGNIRPVLNCITVRGGALGLDEACAKIGNGIYINDVSGVGTGINEQSGDYSLQASGYMIENGKITTPISLMTISSNICTDLANVVEVCNDLKTTYTEVISPSVAIKDISVSGV